MPATLDPIPGKTQIVNPSDGGITEFFRLRWEQLRNGFLQTATVANVQTTQQSAAIATTVLFTTKVAAAYRVAFYLQKTIADGVTSSLTMTISWLCNGFAQSKTFTALTTDALGAFQSDGLPLIEADSGSSISYAVAYASHTANVMQFRSAVTVEQLS